jgi:D-psicose/D-tagatose/L-ribulose 3-epimerase
MRTGMNLLLWTTHVTRDLYPTLGKLKQAGFDGVEIPIFEGTAEHYKDVRRELDKQGLACTVVTVATPEANPISDDAAVREAAVERMKWVLDMTAIVGGDILAGPYHSPLGVFSGTGPTGDELKRAADLLRKTAEMAKKVNVRLALEYLNRFECYLLTTAADTRALVKRVDHPNCRMMYDTFHAHIEEKDQAKAYTSVADSVIHVHISENDRGTPGTGQIHWDDTFRALRQAKYDGWLVIEAFGRALPALAAATKVWRDLFPAAEEVYMQGLRFMKEKWAAFGK